MLCLALYAVMEESGFDRRWEIVALCQGDLHEVLVQKDIVKCRELPSILYVSRFLAGGDWMLERLLHFTGVS